VRQIRDFEIFDTYLPPKFQPFSAVFSRFQPFSGVADGGEVAREVEIWIGERVTPSWPESWAGCLDCHFRKNGY
jgi:hypothetical protein